MGFRRRGLGGAGFCSGNTSGSGCGKSHQTKSKDSHESLLGDERVQGFDAMAGEAVGAAAVEAVGASKMAWLKPLEVANQAS